MIKKVKTEQLQVGVYVHDFNCDTADQKIFINKSYIKSDKAIKILHNWGIKEVYIDTEKGIDELPRKIKAPILPKIPSELSKFGITSPAPKKLVPLVEEVERASEVKNDAVTLLSETATSIKTGTPIDIDKAYRVVEKMEESVLRNKEALLLLTRIRQKDEYTLMHSISVSSMILAFCSFMDMPHETTLNIAMGALFHDIGKTKIPLQILNKPGRLTDEEFEIIKKHSEHSMEILSTTKDLPLEVFDIALHHHERYDGSGYPYGLTGENIGIGSRLASICDVFDAYTSERCYKQGVDRVSGLKKVYDLSGEVFDKELAYDFIRFLGVYPVGTFVRLTNGLVGVVADSGENMLQPIVRVFYDEERKRTINVTELDTYQHGVSVAGYEDVEAWERDKILLFQHKRNELNVLI